MYTLCDDRNVFTGRDLAIPFPQWELSLKPYLHTVNHSICTATLLHRKRVGVMMRCICFVLFSTCLYIAFHSFVILWICSNTCSIDTKAKKVIITESSPSIPRLK